MFDSTDVFAHPHVTGLLSAEARMREAQWVQTRTSDAETKEKIDQVIARLRLEMGELLRLGKESDFARLEIKEPVIIVPLVNGDKSTVLVCDQASQRPLFATAPMNEAQLEQLRENPQIPLRGWVKAHSPNGARSLTVTYYGLSKGLVEHETLPRDELGLIRPQAEAVGEPNAFMACRPFYLSSARRLAEEWTGRSHSDTYLLPPSQVLQGGDRDRDFVLLRNNDDPENALVILGSTGEPVYHLKMDTMEVALSKIKPTLHGEFYLTDAHRARLAEWLECETARHMPQAEAEADVARAKAIAAAPPPSPPPTRALPSHPEPKSHRTAIVVAVVALAAVAGLILWKAGALRWGESSARFGPVVLE